MSARDPFDRFSKLVIFAMTASAIGWAVVAAVALSVFIATWPDLITAIGTVFGGAT